MKKFDVVDIGIIVADIPVKIPYEVLDFTRDTIRVERLELLPGGDARIPLLFLLSLENGSRFRARWATTGWDGWCGM